MWRWSRTAWHRLFRAEVVPAEKILERDEALLKEAWDHFGRLPFDEVDVLVLREMGKTVSGAGMDPNVTGRFPVDPLPAPTAVGRLAVLDLREDSGGNAQGVGSADIVTERLRDKVNWGATYANALASKALSAAKLPVVAHTDAGAFSMALESLVGRGPGTPAWSPWSTLWKCRGWRCRCLWSSRPRRPGTRRPSNPCGRSSPTRVAWYG